MSPAVEIYAPCKVNLHLQIKGARSDGYHELLSVFQEISLNDILRIEPTRGETVVLAEGANLPARNSITSAVNAFNEKTRLDCRVVARVLKRIPSGAGLGGASSDAAAVLRALDALYDTRLSAEELEEIASAAGSDAPFFIRGGSAIVSGRGERISPIQARSDLAFTLLWPEIFISTPEAYRALDEKRRGGAEYAAAAESFDSLAAEYAGPISLWRFRNDFQDLALEEHCGIGEALEALRLCGAEFAAMSGSGSTVFGVFDEYAKARAASERLSKKWKYCFCAASVSSAPEPKIITSA